MAVPDQQFQTIIETIEQTVKETIVAELGKQPPSTFSPLFDLDEFRDQLLQAVRSELRVFKEELLSEMQHKTAPPAPPASVGTQQQKISFWQDFLRGLLGEHLYRRLTK